MTDAEWLSVVEETARDLDALGFEGTANGACAALRKARKGRARAVVLAVCTLRAGGTPRRQPWELTTDVMRWERRVENLEAQLTEAKQRLWDHRMR